jgi:hypothetical protein
MTALDHAETIADKLTAAGIDATIDPRGATPPCVLITPPIATFDIGCGATGTWSLFALAPGPANIDAWRELDRMLGVASGVFPIERSEFVAYSLSPDNPPLPAYRMTFTEGFDL